jgi:hypothetical protein
VTSKKVTRRLLNITITLLLAACISPMVATPADTTAPGSVVTLSPTVITFSPEATWDIYHPDPHHLWNRLFRELYRRTSEDGKEYGLDSLDPLLWPETTHLLDGPSHQQAVQVLDEFLSTRGEDLLTNPFKRALLQRDLWAVFDWLAWRTDPYTEARRALQERLAQAIRRLALTEDEIRSLPNNYQEAVQARVFPVEYQTGNPKSPFLPITLLESDGPWVCVGREGGPIAMSHTAGFPFFGRSAFLVFIRSPGARQATVELLHVLNTEPHPELPKGTEVALVRQMLLIDQEGKITPSPVVESIQLRHFINGINQTFYQFNLGREGWFAGQSGELMPVDKEFILFQSHGVDLFEFDHVEEAPIPELCFGCHVDEYQGIQGSQSILSFSRARFPLPDRKQPVLFETTPELEARNVTTWKLQHQTWQTLEALWRQGIP